MTAEAGCLGGMGPQGNVEVWHPVIARKIESVSPGSWLSRMGEGKINGAF